MTAYDTDVLVAGGGPVGLVAAIEARRRGFDVTVIEPRSDPVDKACGEGLMPSALNRLHRLGIDPSGCAFDGITYVDGDRRVTARFMTGPGRGVRRTTLHDALSARADTVGVRRLPGRVDGLVQDDRSICAASLRARWLVAADGLHSPIRRRLGLELPPGRHRRFGLRSHVATAPWTPYVEVHWAPGSEAYVTPVGDDLVGVAILTDRSRPFPELLAEHRLLADRLAGVAWQRVRGAGPQRPPWRGRPPGQGVG
ncbi:MAG: NAD(P)/FAD-dependent oxidoreductase, partial [Candidatus Nanopelagicales bacterium]